MIVVFGATGMVGREVTEILYRKGVALLACTHRRPVVISEVPTQSVDLRTGKGLDAALEDADRLFLLSADSADQEECELRVVAAAKRHGVSRIVKLSVLGAETRSFHYARLHRNIEQTIEDAGFGFAHLRPAGFMQNFCTHYAADVASGELALPFGEAREQLIHVRDIASAAVHLLTAPDHPQRAVEVHGAAPLNYFEMAEALSEAVKRPIRYLPISEDAYSARLTNFQLQPWLSQALVEMHSYTRSQAGLRPAGNARHVLGRDPISFCEFAAEYAASLPGPPL